MGLSGVEVANQLALQSAGSQLCGLMGLDNLAAFTKQALSCNDNVQSFDQLQVLVQAQALLKKSQMFQRIDDALRKVSTCRPAVHTNLPKCSDDDDDIVTSAHRDAAVNNLRFLNIFYGYSPVTFAQAVNLLDRLLGRVKAHPKYLSCIATTCFYIAAKTQENNVFIPNLTELVRICQCGCSPADLLRMEQLIGGKLDWQLAAVTPLVFLQLFTEVFVDKQTKFRDPLVRQAMIAKLEVLLCQFEFTKYRAETLALSLVSVVLQDMGLLDNNTELFSSFIELQYYCQINDEELVGCRGLIQDYLAFYGSRPSRLPRLHLVWAVSRRTISKLKPSTKVLLDLEPIMEDEDDSGRFDSENDDNDIIRNHFAACAQGNHRNGANFNLANGELQPAEKPARLSDF